MPYGCEQSVIVILIRHGLAILPLTQCPGSTVWQFSCMLLLFICVCVVLTFYAGTLTSGFNRSVVLYYSLRVNLSEVYYNPMDFLYAILGRQT